ncbi:Ribonuclease H-like domain containing protein [Melia azedarach]|uniref:Ribonuclease H-like domain containing protein n=1 Tax=Melia azedarach TaxID=155640 RepID=A0ACC1XPJ2_MELAZ|nr:Ribonuclease H-like domain containing protein [Melia azedarach]
MQFGKRGYLPCISGLSLCQAVEFEKWVVICWAIWFSRNHSIHNKDQQNPKDTLTKVENTWLSFQSVAEIYSINRGKDEAKITPKWQPPCQGRYQINVDVAIDEKAGLTGIGILMLKGKLWQPQSAELLFQ